MKPQSYLVTWSIDVFASSPLEAAKQGLEAQRDDQSIATVFEVRQGGDFWVVDLRASPRKRLKPQPRNAKHR